ncbi:hypothetical protein WA538_005384 [Blastocystis sp. DL]
MENPEDNWDPRTERVLKRICQDIAFEVHQQFYMDELSCHTELSPSMKKALSPIVSVSFDHSIACDDDNHHTVQCTYCNEIIESSRYVKHLLNCMPNHSSP